MKKYQSYHNSLLMPASKKPLIQGLFAFEVNSSVEPFLENLPITISFCLRTCYTAITQTQVSMAKGILGIEFDLLEEMLRTIVRQEMD